MSRIPRVRVRKHAQVGMWAGIESFVGVTSAVIADNWPAAEEENLVYASPSER